jgi:hypothetical protein
MKSISIPKFFTGAAMAIGLAVATNAQPLVFNFDNAASSAGFTNVFTWSSGPSGWSGGGCMQASLGVSGWQMNLAHEFGWWDGEQTIMQSLSAGGLGHLSLDVIWDGTSFPIDTGGVWYNINMAANSGGANGWTQFENITGVSWHNQGDTALYSVRLDYSFAQLGWGDAADATGWFQLWLGSNSNNPQTVDYYIDNVKCYAAPEPSTFALAGLGAAALLIARRRK